MKSYFNRALAISLGLHIALMGGFPSRTAFKIKNEDVIQPKIEFVEIKKDKSIQLHEKPSLKDPPPYIDIKKELLSLKKTRNTAFEKPNSSSTILNTKEVVFQKTKDELDSFPAYINYYEQIRETIRRAAYSGFHSKTSGKVFLNFTVDNSGNLVSIYLDPDNSSQSRLLRRIAMDSIEASSPFPRFPSELTQFKTLTFNLSIHFRNN
ncbi:MAG: TonB C-terminal domain-containing protein [Candidatus Omnitrophica bacterium]|nr:TonB C-terminal domain-containing protein [Candidatus Omnitrophota bacterium]